VENVLEGRNTSDYELPELLPPQSYAECQAAISSIQGKIDNLLSDNQVTVACATLGKLCQVSLLPLTKNITTSSSEINTINLLNLKLMSPKTHVQYATPSLFSITLAI
jgi:hypothetical protein